MTIEEIYHKFDQIGTFTFATIDNGRPSTRIAHLFAYDDDGLYFRTMTVKPFYRQLKETGMVAIGGMYPNTTVTHNDEGMPEWEPGYTINLSGDVREVSLEQLKQKAETAEMFELGVKDIERYPAIVAFCIHRGLGEVFDYDFETKERDHKLLRIPFSFGGLETTERGVRISADDCIGCGKCLEACSFKAISKDGDKYRIDKAKCDVCGDCTLVCPVEAIEVLQS